MPIEVKTYSRKHVCIWLTFWSTMAAWAMAWEAAESSPGYDEPAHLASGLVGLRYGDLGYFHVNPPLPRLWSAAVVQLFMDVKLGDPGPSNAHGPAGRPEFVLGQELIEKNQDRLRGVFCLARLCRIPLVIAAGILLYFVLGEAASRASMIASMLWFSSPLILGHGWVIGTDVFSAAASVGILAGTRRWLQRRTWRALVLCGITWGLAFGTKYTFLPVSALFPLALLAWRIHEAPWNWKDLLELIGGYLLQLLLALVILGSFFGFAGVGESLGSNRFASHALRFLSSETTADSAGWRSALRSLPSPVPRLVLTGIDTQQVQLESPNGFYLLGRTYSGKVFWSYFAAYPIKEQIAVWIGVLSWLVWVGVRLRGRGSSSADAGSRRRLVSCSLVLLSLTTIVFLVVSAPGTLPSMLRYVCPALPAIYLLIGIWTPTVDFTLGRKRIDVILLVMFAASLWSVAATMPCHFSYANPLVGGMYRSPPALHESSFDSGQDLWRLEAWLETHFPDASHKAPRPRLYTLAHGSALPALKRRLHPPSPETMRQVIEARRRPLQFPTTLDDAETVVVVPRGFCHAMKWNLAHSNISPDDDRSEIARLAAELVACRPDLYISPTYAAYCLKK